MQIADRFVQSGGVRMAQRQRAGKMLQSFGIGVKGACPLSGDLEMCGGFNGISGLEKVPGDHPRQRSGLAPSGCSSNQGFSYPAMQQPATRQADLIIDQAPELVVGKVV